MKIMQLKYLVIIGVLIISCFSVYFMRDSIRKSIYSSILKPITFSSENNLTLPYRVYSPKIVKGDKYPLVLSLHPWGENGTDNRKQLNSTHYHLARSKFAKSNPCFIIAPQCPQNREWVNKGKMRVPFKHYLQKDYPETQEMQNIIAYIQNLVKNNPIDTNRIYVIGFSMGATGCWDILSRYPELFAGSIIASGVSDTTVANKLKHIPIWAFSGQQDSIAPADLNINMVDAINEAGGHAKITIYPNLSHNIAYKAFNHPEVFIWLFNQRKKQSPT